jgi:hypothetical protein
MLTVPVGSESSAAETLARNVTVCPLTTGFDDTLATVTVDVITGGAAFFVLSNTAIAAPVE